MVAPWTPPGQGAPRLEKWLSFFGLPWPAVPFARSVFLSNSPALRGFRPSQRHTRWFSRVPAFFDPSHRGVLVTDEIGNNLLSIDRGKDDSIILLRALTLWRVDTVKADALPGYLDGIAVDDAELAGDVVGRGGRGRRKGGQNSEGKLIKADSYQHRHALRDSAMRFPAMRFMQCCGEQIAVARREISSMSI